MAFVVDGAQWGFDGLAASKVLALVENFLERIAVARDRAEVVWIGEDFQTRPIIGDHDLWSLMADNSVIQFPREVWQELAGWLTRARCYLDENEWPDGFEAIKIGIDDEQPSNNIDIDAP
jgi:hypothetical protein